MGKGAKKKHNNNSNGDKSLIVAATESPKEEKGAVEEHREPKPKDVINPKEEPPKPELSASNREEPLICAICNAPAVSRCGGCQKASYCSKDHQRSHWKSHKGECCPWKLSQNKELGRHLIASRDIKAGEIVIQERPLLITPPKITQPLCLGCYSEFKSDGLDTDDGRGVKPFACRNSCGWPMCKSSVCHNSKDHISECTLARNRGQVVIRYADCEHPLYQTIGLLRVLGLQENDPSSYEKLISLESNTEKRKEFNRKMEEDAANNEMPDPGPSGSRKPIGPEASIKLLQTFFNRPDISEEWILKLMGIIETNGHEIPIPDQDGRINRRVIGVYHNSSFLEHNCVANCVKSYELSTKEIVIRSSVPIKKGEHLSISYVDPLWGTNDRVNLLRMTKFFNCTCARCRQPSELGTHVSSLRCQHLKCMKLVGGKEGMIVPLDPYKPDVDWKCQSCGEDYNVSYVSSLVQRAGSELEEMGVGDIGAKEDYLKRFHKLLSPHHFYLLEVKVELAQLYGRTEEEPLQLLAPKKLLRKIFLCEELLGVFNTIAPGYNRLRALIIYELQAAVFVLSRMRRSVEEISMEQHLDEMMQCGKWMSEVIKVLGWESHNSIERKRAMGAERDLEQLKNAVLSLQQPSSDPSPPKAQTPVKTSPQQQPPIPVPTQKTRVAQTPSPPKTSTTTTTPTTPTPEPTKTSNVSTASATPSTNPKPSKKSTNKSKEDKNMKPTNTTEKKKASGKSSSSISSNSKSSAQIDIEKKVAEEAEALLQKRLKEQEEQRQIKLKEEEERKLREEQQQRSHLSVDEDSFIEEVF